MDNKCRCQPLERTIPQIYARAFGVEAGWILFGERADVEFPGLYRVPVISMVSVAWLPQARLPRERPCWLKTRPDLSRTDGIRAKSSHSALPQPTGPVERLAGSRTTISGTGAAACESREPLFQAAGR